MSTAVLPQSTITSKVYVSASWRMDHEFNPKEVSQPDRWVAVATTGYRGIEFVVLFREDKMNDHLVLDLPTFQLEWEEA